MRIKFKNLRYQQDAIKSIVRVFDGDQINKNTSNAFTTFNDNVINDSKILKNVQDIQNYNQITPRATGIYGDSAYNYPQFTIEMETGTGKTFIYLKSIFELNKKYNFKKFIIVVPSIAIKEGVLKTLNEMTSVFHSDFSGVHYNYFTYDPTNRSEISNFTKSSTIEIMIINTQSFNKKNNNRIYQNDESFNGNTGINVVAQSHPILILDEPQSYENGSSTQKALPRFNPLVAFRFSATPKDKSYPTIYRLDAIDAYKKHLVKQIEVDSDITNNNGNKALLRIQDIIPKKAGIIAHVLTYYKKRTGQVSIKKMTLHLHNNLYRKTHLSVYKKFGNVRGMDASKGVIYFSGNPAFKTIALSKKEQYMDVKDKFDLLIHDHLDKELVLNKRGIKVLSLIFLDNVANYRIYTKNGVQKGPYAKIFENEYKKIINQHKYAKLNDRHIPASEVHEGYFSKDRHNHIKNSRGNTKADDSTYQIIMKDKEQLLTMYNPAKGHVSKPNKIRFIFSHSALREGWDNPNIFQILTFNTNIKNKISQRQKIGRGLRIAVDQNGNRISDPHINVLTIIASESYENFAKELQHEYEINGERFSNNTPINQDAFEAIEVTNNGGNKEHLNSKLSHDIYAILELHDCLTNDDRIKSDINPNKLISILSKVPNITNHDILSISNWIIKRVNSKIHIENHRDKVTVHVNKNALTNPNFLKLWNRIKYQTTFTVNINSKELVKKSIGKINQINVSNPTKIYSKDKIKINREGFKNNVTTKTKVIHNNHYTYPNIVKDVMNYTMLTKRSIIKIFSKVSNLDNFKLNPIEYINKSITIINNIKINLMVKSIKYTKTDNKTYDINQLYKAIISYKDRAYKVPNKSKTVYNYIITDSIEERNFASELNNSDNIKFYLKLPSWFTINTPLGSYNPDWAIVSDNEQSHVRNLYFVADTKGSTNIINLRNHELDQLQCGKKHFMALETGVLFRAPITKLSDLYLND